MEENNKIRNRIKPASAEADESDVQNTWISDFILARTISDIWKQVRILRKNPNLHPFWTQFHEWYLAGGVVGGGGITKCS